MDYKAKNSFMCWLIGYVWMSRFADYIHKFLLLFNNVSASWQCPFSSLKSCVKLTMAFCMFIWYFIMILPLLTLHCYDVTLWQAWCFLELLWTWFLNLLPCLSSKFGTHFFNLAVLLWNLQRFGLEVGSSLHTAEVKSIL